MFFQQKDRHEQMAKLDPRDTNGDGVVTPRRRPRTFTTTFRPPAPKSGRPS
ncbi:hypothetical protein [Deinococcus aquaticus]|uniref:hypothetical protein n=1 Tax=Deinococcus aquaticus TaxID=328692 RepID=UPI00362102B5